jgi:hypothetical protein
LEPTKSSVSEFFFGADHCLLIPAYQRTYEWDRARWQGLISDIARKAANKSTDDKKHWIGILITSKAEERCPFDINRIGHRDLDIIDGQQRVLTLQVWLMALKDYALDRSIEIEEFKFKNIQCQETNNAELMELSNGNWRNYWKTYSSKESGLIHAYIYFRWLLWLGKDALESTEEEPLPKLQTGQYATLSIEDQWERALEQRRRRAEQETDNDLSEITITRNSDFSVQDLLNATLQKMSLLVVERQPEDEPASELFDALNGQRMTLAQFDHLRNFIFTGITDKEIRNDIYSNLWKNSEIAVEKSQIKPKGGTNALDLFLYDFMISLGEARFQKRINRTKTINHFIKYFESRRNIDDQNRTRNHENIAKNLILPSIAYWILINKFGEKFWVGSKSYELPRKIKKDLVVINALSTTPVIPFLMNSLSSRFEKGLSEEETGLQIRAVRNYLIREVVVGTNLQPLRAQIMSAIGRLGPNYSTTSLVELLKDMQSNNDKIKDRLLPYETRTSFKYKDQGSVGDGLTPKQIISILQVIEASFSGDIVNNFLDGDPEFSEQFSLEHIYPQNPDPWVRDLGLWGIKPQDMKDRIQVLGNLTVVPMRLNSKLNNKKFSEKVEIINDRENQCPLLKINSEWMIKNQWNPTFIDERTEMLVGKIIECSTT